MQLEDVYQQLAAPFEPRQVGLKPQSIKDGRALALPYIDSRAVQERLDQVVGPGNWSDSYQVISKAAVLCRLTVLGVTKEGIGEAGGTPGEEALKSAESDSLKLESVK